MQVERFVSVELCEPFIRGSISYQVLQLTIVVYDLFQINRLFGKTFHVVNELIHEFISVMVQSFGRIR